MRERMFDLLKRWSNRLLELQLPEAYGSGLAGGIVCPACSRIHGRCADAVYGLVHMAHATGDEKYLEASIRLQAWAEGNVTEPDGSWINDVVRFWNGTTVFGTIALGETLRMHGEILQDRVREQWRHRLHRAADFLHGFMAIDTGNINYPLTCSAALAVASIVLEEPKYADRARELAHEGLEYFTENGILFGEGRPQQGLSTRGCRPIDLGYNVEETIPGMILYAHLTGDAQVLDAMEVAARAHLAFMLPDGAWDNSWGTRNFKWTYWGSRTSDGCQSGYIMLADRDPVFAEAAYRNLELLHRCTHDGLLYGGPDLHHHGEPPCVHHTFCHVKVLAGGLDWFREKGLNGEYERVPLPRETAAGVKHYPEMETWLAAEGPWRATVTAYDSSYGDLSAGHAAGGSLSMLYHMNMGTILTASMSLYQMQEPHNMQRHRNGRYMPLTPRLELVQDGRTFASVFDRNAVVQVREKDGSTTFTVDGYLRSAEQEHPAGAALPFRIMYVLGKEDVTIRVEHYGAYNPCFLLPVIARSSDGVQTVGESTVTIERTGGIIRIEADAALSGVRPERVFNHVPGFEAIPLCAEVGDRLCIKIRIN